MIYSRNKTIRMKLNDSEYKDYEVTTLKVRHDED